MPSRELQLIVNADDFGQSDDTVDATIECFEAGALTSATLMPGMPATERALEFARAHPEHGFGVHLTLSADPARRPLADPELVPCLVDTDGTLLSTREVRARALTGRLVPQQLEREIEAQVRSVLDAGVPVSHVDSHRHLHKFAPVRAALASVLPRLGIRRVRAVQDLYVSRPLAQPDLLARPSLARVDPASVRDDRALLHAFEDRKRPWSEAVAGPDRAAGSRLARDRRAPRPRGGVARPGPDLRGRARSRRRRARPARRLADARRGSGASGGARGERRHPGARRRGDDRRACSRRSAARTRRPRR